MKSGIYALGGIAMMLLLVLVVPGVQAAPLSGTARTADVSEQLTVAKAAAAYGSALEEARMDGAIGYITGISAGTGAGQLPDLRATFAQTADSVPGMTTIDQIKAARDQMQGTAKEFRTGTISLMKQYKGSAQALKAAVNASVEANAGTLASLRATAWQDRETNRLNMFDTHVSQAQGLITNLSAKGVDVTAAQNALATVQADRPALEAAFTTNDNTAVKTALEQVKKDWGTFTDALKTIRSTVKANRQAARQKAGSPVATPVAPAAEQ